MLDHASIGAFVNITDDDFERVEDDLRTLRELGLDHLEVWLEYQPTRRELEELAALLRGWTTIMHGPFVGMSLATDWDALAGISLDRCHQAIEAAGVLGCHVVTLHAGAYGAFGSHEEALNRVAGRIARFTRISRPAITIENLPARRGASREAVTASSDFDALVGTLAELRMTLDVGHCVQNGEDPAEVASRHVRRVSNIHLHDATPGGSGHAALGNGALAVDELLTRLDADGYDRFMTIETLTRDDLRASLDVLASMNVRPGRRNRPGPDVGQAA
jgi:sugar phosphate isomerase/epimerase